MKLEEVSAVLRPRRSWEAADLGCALVRRHARTIYGAWMLTVLPLYVLIAAVLWSHPVWALLLIVFLKPIAGRVPLHVISRGMFGDTPSVGKVVRAFPGMLSKNALVHLFANRLSLNRCFFMPVIELESSDKKTRKERISALSRLSDVAGSVSFFASIIEVCMLVSLILFTILIIPESMIEEMSWSWLEFQLTSSLGDLTPIIQFILVYQILAITLVEPFYVGAGFGLYLNARSILEGWDVELSFRRIAKRLDERAGSVTEGKRPTVSRGAVSGIVIGLLAVLLVGWQPSMYAQEVQPGTDEASEESTDNSVYAGDQETAAEILEGSEFDVKKSKVWVPADKEEDSSDFQSGSGISGFSEFLQIVFWLLVIGAVAVIVYFVVTALKGKKISMPARSPKPESQGIKTYQGMNITPQSLPYDITTAARDLWEKGSRTEALGLLYRGAISWMVHAASLAIEESFTEGDCRRLVDRALPASGEAAYFHRLTGHWMTTAYAQLPPSDEEFSRLCEAWPFVVTNQPEGKEASA